METLAQESSKAVDTFLHPSHKFGPCLEKATEVVRNIVHIDKGSQCHDRDRTYPYRPYPDLSTPTPSHLNHSQALNTKPEPSDPLASQQRTPEHSDPLASSQHIPDPTHLRPFLSLTSSRFPTTTLIPDPMSFNLHSFASSLFPTFHRSRDCSRAKPNRVPPSLDAS